MNDFKIKPELKEKWMDVVGKNCCDGYSFGVVVATVKVFEALDAGKAAEESMGAMHGLGITGYMAGCVAEWVGKFHERGDEFRKAWNKFFGVDETKANGGTVNPAIVTIGK